MKIKTALTKVPAISIKIKMAIFVVLLIVLVIFVVSTLLLSQLQKQQVLDVENTLNQQTEIAETFLRQNLVTEYEYSAASYLIHFSESYAKEVEKALGKSVVLFNVQGKQIHPDSIFSVPKNKDYAVQKALTGATVTIQNYSHLYLFAPLVIDDEVVAALQLSRSMQPEKEFYQQMQQRVLQVAIVSALFSFTLGVIYFARIGNGIAVASRMVAGVEAGNYRQKPFKRKDELGKLTVGIEKLGLTIQETLAAKKRETEKLELAVAKLSRLDDQQKEFLSSVTHEFKTPLTVIRANLDLVKLYPDDEELVSQLISAVETESQRLLEMVEKVLSLSAIEKYEFELKLEEIELWKLVEDAWTALAGKAKRYQVTGEITQAILPVINADKDLTTIAVLNLLDNAIKYNKVGGSIKVDWKVTEDELVMRVADSGPGIPASFHKTLFEPFTTVDSAKSRARAGVGLGLAITSKYLHLQQANIELVSSTENGSVFEVSFKRN